MRIDVPNGETNTPIMLKDVLYCPELGYTLVLLAKCNTTSFTIILKEGAWTLKATKLVAYLKYKVYTVSMTLEL